MSAIALDWSSWPSDCTFLERRVQKLVHPKYIKHIPLNIHINLFAEDAEHNCLRDFGNGSDLTSQVAISVGENPPSVKAKLQK
jgi:hypothetical protein